MLAQILIASLEVSVLGIVKSISAIGTRGDAKGELFVAKPDTSGRYVLNRKKSAGSPSPTNHAVNKVYAATLCRAAELLATGCYLINLTSSSGRRALREMSKVRVERSGV